MVIHLLSTTALRRVPGLQRFRWLMRHLDAANDSVDLLPLKGRCVMTHDVVFEGCFTRCS